MSRPALTYLVISIVVYLALVLLTDTWNPAESVTRLAAEAIDLGWNMTLTSSTRDDAGNVLESPEDLAAAAGATLGTVVGVEEYALARMLRNERTSSARGGNDDEGAAIVWVARNDANAHNGGDILACLTGGYGFGKQGSKRKYASSAQDPRDVDLALVRRCMSGEIPDPTGGATHFMHRTGFQTHDDYVAVVNKWQARGWSNVGLDVGTSLEVWT